MDFDQFSAGYLDRLFPLRELPYKVLNRIARSKRVQKILAPVGSIPTPDRWIFVVGCYNSGTTLLKLLLRAHPEIGGVRREGIYFTDALPHPEEFGWPRMWYRCLDDVRIEPTPEARDRANRIKRQWSIWFPTRFPNLVEKSVSNATRLPFLHEFFRPAYFIHIVRNGFAVSEGIRRKADPRSFDNPEYKSAYPIEACAKQWVRSDEIVSADRDAVDRLMTLKYEELTEAPDAVLDRIWEFLDLRPDASLDLDRDWHVHGLKAPIRNMNPRSFESLTSDEVARIHDVAGEVLEKYDYETPTN